jgi:hypothetical protein
MIYSHKLQNVSHKESKRCCDEVVVLLERGRALDRRLAHAPRSEHAIQLLLAEIISL